eukprot:g9039.t1
MGADAVVKFVVPVAANKGAKGTDAQQRPWYNYKKGEYSTPYADQRGYQWPGKHGFYAAAAAIEYLLTNEVDRSEEQGGESLFYARKTYLFGYSAGAVLSMHVGLGKYARRPRGLRGIFSYHGMMHAFTLSKLKEDYEEQKAKLRICDGVDEAASDEGRRKKESKKVARRRALPLPVPQDLPKHTSGPVGGSSLDGDLQVVVWAAGEINPDYVAPKPARKQKIKTLKKNPAQSGDGEIMKDPVEAQVGLAHGVPSNKQAEFERLVDNSNNYAKYWTRPDPPYFAGDYVKAKTEYVFAKEDAITTQRGVRLLRVILREHYTHPQMGQEDIGEITRALVEVVVSGGDEDQHGGGGSKSMENEKHQA